MPKACSSAGPRGPFSCIETRPLPAADPPPATAVAAATPGSCLVCCGPSGPGYAHCFACRTVASLLRLPLSPVLPVRLCPVPGPLYTVLMGYKESPVDEARRRFAHRVGELFAAFFAAHRCCATALLGGTADLIIPVPSSSRPGPASLERVEGLADLAESALGPHAHWAPTLLARAGGPIGHMHPNARAFAVPAIARGTVSGARVVLLDDTYVSGARAQSAAATLRSSGARSILIVPLGRVLRPDRSSSHAAFLGNHDAGCAGHLGRCVAAQTAAGMG